MMSTIDLHVHSNYSDGIHPPADLVKMAAERGLVAIAIADHDTVDGIDEALIAGARLGVEVVPAVELSAEHGRYRDMHILGYHLDHRDPRLVDMLAEFRINREIRGRAIVDKINQRLADGRKPLLSYDEVLNLAEGAVGRPHIGRMLIERGYARNMEDAFRRYLIPCNVPKRYIPAGDAITEIRRAGGVAVLAHPITVSDDRQVLRGIVSELVALGLDGIEVFNNMCYKDDMLFLEFLCRESGLLMTGGSDFHGFEDDVEIGSGRGGLAVSHRLAEAVKNLAESRRITPPGSRT
ncbi:PHP domain protein [Geobacter metallireducens RCH3]|uniref:Metal-dependent phosphoesterase, PHP family n=1 Tax=Geobacter metallireducens (strain ATCC 53774 / DSM 7210 / GS-15) TaxID=269799 RepID=Q39U70_GEOMG|nr:PHP domain-containing protein [Geobacter metallireducens]ABB32204.1 metal-dependent phosphoesterase, PHP family [Geobacter metallireducens GS-15]EHP88607.1 PHP domain protein [Geobacter metallireducens RCH3]